jgi:hypothetical protein
MFRIRELLPDKPMHLTALRAAGDPQVAGNHI